jgi:hypothetical protein
MSLQPGTVIGPYEVLGMLGAGGMGEVYRARDSRLGRDVAIKVLLTSTTDDPDRRARFEREAQAVAALSHPNVIAIFDTGVHEHQLYVVMELLAGETLRERIGTNVTGFSVRKAVEIAVQIARGLGAAHAKGIVHRDLKPENIFLLDDGQVKILDFGLARQAAATEPSGATRTIAATDPGTVMGTVFYMAPEQVRGQAIDARADVFAFGAVLYEMLTGQRAFQRDTAADTMSAILTQEPPELVGSRPDLSPALDKIVRHCLEKNANERFQNARDIAFAIEAISTGSTGSTGATGTTATATAPPRGRVFSAGPAAAAVVGALVLGGIGGFVGRGGTPATSAGVADVVYTPVTFEEGFVYAARFAPDGRTIVYSADWDDQPRGVYVTSLDSADYRSLGFTGADLLGISRAGELAILTGSTVVGGSAYYRRGTLAKASLTGGAGRAEIEGVTFADIAPDNAMAVIRYDGRRCTVEYPVGQVLAEVPLAGGGGQCAFAALRVSPSGDHVAYFDTRVPSAFTVKVFDRAGKFVTESGPFADWWAPAWTPSNEVWFAAAEASGSQTTIFSLDLAGRQRTVYRAPGAITLHDISSQGDVLMSLDRGRTRAEFLEPSDATPQDRSWREAGRVAALSNDHALLINGVGDSGGSQGSVYVWQPRQPRPVRIAGGAGLAIAPDGSKALVVSLETPPRISMVPTGAGQPQAIDAGVFESIAWAGWLPDGRLVLQGVRAGSPEAVFVRSAAGGDLVPLLPAGVTLLGTNLISPDGSRIMAVDAAGRIVLCTVSTSVPACAPIAGVREGDVASGWTADGRSAFVYQPQPGQVQVDRIDVASGRRSAWKTIRPLNPALSGVRGLIVAPDGAIAYGYGRSRSELYVIKGLK